MIEVNIRNYAIMASGQGSNALALIKKGLDLGRPPQFVIINKADSPLFELAKEQGIKVYSILSSPKGIDLDFEARVLNLCETHQVDWLFLAGFLKILSSSFINHFQQLGFSQIVNIHPSLLPKYPGLGGYKLAFTNNDNEFGHTIHLVTEGVDEGPVIYQKVIAREENWNFEEFTTVGKKSENKSYGLVLESLLKNGLSWDGQKAELTWELNI